MTTTTYVTDASIGEIAFHQNDLSDFAFTADDWMTQALYLFDKKVPDVVQWLPYQSEIRGPVGRYSGEGPSLIWLRTARECMDVAFQQLAAGYVADEDDVDLTEGTDDACFQLVRYAGCVYNVEILRVLQALTDINDDAHHGRHLDCIKKDVEEMKALLDAVVAGYDN